jgi:hypothetical protein
VLGHGYDELEEGQALRPYADTSGPTDGQFTHRGVEIHAESLPLTNPANANLHR